MTFEVMAPQIGEVRIRDVRAAVGDAVRQGEQLVLFVLGIAGEPPYIGPVSVGGKRSGHSVHLALVCPSCTEPRAVLYVRGGNLACAGCGRRRTRRQSERSLATWSRGGREEDRLLRMVGKGRDPALLRAIVSELIEGDLDRASVIENEFHTAVLCIEVRS